jgi:hypothetical protein
MVKRTFVALSLAVFVVANAASAQENATFTLRSGERLTGQLIDLGGVGFTARINGQERQIPANDVAVIDFTGGGGTQADWDRLNNGQFVVLKDGQILTGQLTDVGGLTPLRLTFRIGGNERNIPSSDVARIVLARPNDSSPSIPSTPGGSQGFTVSARQPWTATGITVRRGEWMTVTATGEIKTSRDDNDRATPNGTGRTHPSNPLPGVSGGTLIGRIGNSRPFIIGSQNRFQAPAAGQLFLGINDSVVEDNDGEFRVEIQRVTVQPRR